MSGAAGFIPVLHAATDSRPDEIDTIVAFVTSSMVEPLVAPSVAVMFVLPGVSPVAIGLVLPMEATAVLEELHVT